MLGERRDTLTDIELHSLLRDRRREMPEIGQSMAIGRLHSMGFHVQRERVRVAIRAVDPLNTALRAPGALTKCYCRVLSAQPKNRETVEGLAPLCHLTILLPLLLS